MPTERIRKFYEENRQGLYAYALSLTRHPETAEDVVHIAIGKLLERPVLPWSLKPYAYKCVRNAAVDEWRRQAPNADGQVDFDAMPAASAGLEGQGLLELLFELKAEEREVILLKVINGLTLQEIAELGGRSINTVASQYRRGLEKVRALMQEDER